MTLRPANSTRRSQTVPLFHLTLLVLSGVLALDLGAILLLSRYFNYGAEGIEMASLLRRSMGLSYMTRVTDIPWFVNQYSPYFYAVAYAPIRLLGLTSLEAIALCARSVVLVSALATMICAYRHFRGSQHFSRSGFVFVSVWFVLLFPANIASARPDFPAFLLEFLGFAAWNRGETSDAARLRSVATAGLLFGSALAFKINTLGVVSGLLVYEATERRWCRALVLAVVTLTAAVLYLALSWKLWGGDMLRDTFLALQNQMETPLEIANRLATLVFYAAPLGALAALGFRRLGVNSTASTRSLVFVILSSAVLATLQQVKAGAWYNYYYGTFVLVLGPAAVGLDSLLSDTNRSTPVALAVLGISVVQAAWSARVPAVIGRDYFREHYPFTSAKAWVARELPRGPIYSEDPNALLHFQSRVLLGSNAEIVLNLTPALQPFVPTMLKKMRATPYVAAIATGPSCANWRPQGLFHSTTARLTQLSAQFGWICVYTPRAAHD